MVVYILKRIIPVELEERQKVLIMYKKLLFPNHNGWVKLRTSSSLIVVRQEVDRINILRTRMGRTVLKMWKRLFFWLMQMKCVGGV